jgi:hypothetical protein
VSTEGLSLNSEHWAEMASVVRQKSRETKGGTAHPEPDIVLGWCFYSINQITPHPTHHLSLFCDVTKLALIYIVLHQFHHTCVFVDHLFEPGTR